jgi:hypothetical protein
LDCSLHLLVAMCFFLCLLLLLFVVWHRGFACAFLQPLTFVVWPIWQAQCAHKHTVDPKPH